MSFLDGLLHRLRVLGRGEEYASELQDEQRFHRELEAMQQGHAGAAPDEADFAARRLFGNRTGYAEATRQAAGFDLTDRLRQDVTCAWRGIRRSPGLAITIMATFALGVGANAAVYSFLARVLLRPPGGVIAPERVHRLYVGYPNRNAPATPTYREIVSYPDFVAVRDALEGWGRVAATAWADTTSIIRSNGTVRVRRAYVTDEYLPLLVRRPATGRFFTRDEDDPEAPTRVAVLSYSLWRRLFDRDPAAVGGEVEVGGERYTVVGIAPRGFSGIDANGSVDVWVPFSTKQRRTVDGTPWYRQQAIGFGVVLRANEGVPDAQVEARALAAYNAAFLHETPSDTARPVLLGSIILNRGPQAPPQEVSVALRLAGVSIVLLLIAVANVANLLLVRASRRRREIAIRLSLGVGHRRLMSQLLSEGLMLALLAGAAAVLIAIWGDALLRTQLMPGVRWDGRVLDGRLLGLAIGVAAVCGLLAGLVPALAASRPDHLRDLHGGAREGGARKSRLRATLLAAQTALAVVLLTGAGLTLRSLRNVLGIDIGYDSREVLVESSYFPDERSHRELGPVLEELAARLRTRPGVQSVSLSRGAPSTSTLTNPIFVPDADSSSLEFGGDYPVLIAVSPEFFSTFGMRVVTGRSFTESDVADRANIVIVSRTLADRLWPGRNPLGRCIINFRRTNPCNTVVGVVSDFHAWRVTGGPTMSYFVPLGQLWTPGHPLRPQNLEIRSASASQPGIAADVRRELLARLPGAQVTVTPPALTLDRQYRPWRVSAILVSGVGALAVIVAVIGVYSVIAFAFAERTHEMGVRVALGASGPDLVRLVLGSGVRIVGVGVLLGIALSLALARLAQALLYNVPARDPVSLAGAGMVLLIAGVAAALPAALRASRVDPVAVLRDE